MLTRKKLAIVVLMIGLFVIVLPADEAEAICGSRCLKITSCFECDFSLFTIHCQINSCFHCSEIFCLQGDEEPEASLTDDFEARLTSVSEQRTESCTVESSLRQELPRVVDVQLLEPRT